MNEQLYKEQRRTSQNKNLLVSQSNTRKQTFNGSASFAFSLYIFFLKTF